MIRWECYVIVVSNYFINHISKGMLLFAYNSPLIFGVLILVNGSIKSFRKSLSLKDGMAYGTMYPDTVVL